MLVSFKDGGQRRPRSKSLLDYHMALRSPHCWIFGSHFITVLRPPGHPLNDVISPSSAFTLLDRKKKEERKEKEKAREGGTELNWGILAPAGLPGKGTDLASHHTQLCISICVSMHVSAFACKGVRILVRDWESAQREETCFKAEN